MNSLTRRKNARKLEKFKWVEWSSLQPHCFWLLYWQWVVEWVFWLIDWLPTRYRNGWANEDKKLCDCFFCQLENCTKWLSTFLFYVIVQVLQFLWTQWRQPPQCSPVWLVRCKNICEWHVNSRGTPRRVFFTIWPLVSDLGLPPGRSSTDIYRTNLYSR